MRRKWILNKRKLGQASPGADANAAASPGADANADAEANAGAEADTKSEPKADPAPPVDALSVYFIGAEGDLKGPVNGRVIRNWYYSKRLAPTTQARLVSETSLSSLPVVVATIEKRL